MFFRTSKFVLIFFFALIDFFTFQWKCVNWKGMIIVLSGGKFVLQFRHFLLWQKQLLRSSRLSFLDSFHKCSSRCWFMAMSLKRSVYYKIIAIV